LKKKAFSAKVIFLNICHLMLSPSLYRFLFTGTLLFVKSSLFGNEITFSEQILGRILDREERFFAKDSVHEKNEKEMTRQAQEIVANYENYIAQNPKDTNALNPFRKISKESRAGGTCDRVFSGSGQNKSKTGSRQTAAG
jgi:hypothetical protein